MNRRAFLRAAALTAAAVGTASCGVNELGAYSIEPEEYGLITPGDQRILRRLCYGPTAREVQQVAQRGIAGWIEGQLAQEPFSDFELRLRLRNYGVLDKDTDELEGFRRNRVIQLMREGTLIRKVFSEWQLYELMVEFWTDHFNISVEKGDCWYLKVVDDREVIRAHALGNFRELLNASAKSPAMLVYLDNQANQRGAPNENYARELLELHTLGIDGGYNQQDILELARSLTGWTVKEHFWLGRYTFDPDLHDNSRKHVLGKSIDPNGEAEVEGILDQLALHPSTAQHIAFKLVQRFISDNPLSDAPALVTKTQQAFLQSKGDIRTTLRALLLDGMAHDPGGMMLKFKRPLDFIVSSLRQTDSDTGGKQPLHNYLAQMGQPLFAWPTPDGPPMIANHWMANLAPRWKFAFELASGRLGATELPMGRWLSLREGYSIEDVIERIGLVLLGGMGKDGIGRIQEDVLPGIGGLNEDSQIRAVIAGMLASPAFQYR